jgi:hypothetical protein
MAPLSTERTPGVNGNSGLMGLNAVRLAADIPCSFRVYLPHSVTPCQRITSSPGAAMPRRISRVPLWR